MRLTDPEPVVAASDIDVESLVGVTRAEIAELSLRVRSTTHEAVELEGMLAAAPHAEQAERELLGACLEELVDARRRELESALQQEREQLAALLEEARVEADRAAAAAAADHPAARRLHAVALPVDDPDRAPHGEEREERGEVAPGRLDNSADEVCPECAVVDGGAGAGIPEGDDLGGGRPFPPGIDPSATIVAADQPFLIGLVAAAAAAAVSQVLEATATAQPGAQPAPVEPSAPRAPVRGRERPAVGRQLLHLDVLLPLLAAVIVLAVLLAWVG